MRFEAVLKLENGWYLQHPDINSMQRPNVIIRPSRRGMDRPLLYSKEKKIEISLTYRDFRRQAKKPASGLK